MSYLCWDADDTSVHSSTPVIASPVPEAAVGDQQGAVQRNKQQKSSLDPLAERLPVSALYASECLLPWNVVDTLRMLL